MTVPSLSIRELTRSDIPRIADYWLHSSPEHLLGMGADPAKLPARAQFSQMLSRQIVSHYSRKQNYALIWLVEGIPTGHCNVNMLKFGEEAYMHLHIWEQGKRKQGMGADLVRLSLPWFFENLELQFLYSEPYAHNPAPNRTLEKVGFEYLKTYTTTPGSLNFEQEVKRWALSREKYKAMGLPWPQ